MYENIYNLKCELKKRAQEIREKRTEHKKRQKEKNDHSMEFEIFRLSWRYRHHHIAYCELRGKSRNKIEIPREGNEPSESYIMEIKKAYEQKTLCTGT